MLGDPNAVREFVLAAAQRYDPRAGTGTMITLMLPYSVVFLVVWTALLLALPLVATARSRSANTRSIAPVTGCTTPTGQPSWLPVARPPGGTLRLRKERATSGLPRTPR